MREHIDTLPVRQVTSACCLYVLGSLARVLKVSGALATGASVQGGQFGAPSADIAGMTTAMTSPLLVISTSTGAIGVLVMLVVMFIAAALSIRVLKTVAAKRNSANLNMAHMGGDQSVSAQWWDETATPDPDDDRDAVLQARNGAFLAGLVDETGAPVFNASQITPVAAPVAAPIGGLPTAPAVRLPAAPTIPTVPAAVPVAPAYARSRPLPEPRLGATPQAPSTQTATAEVPTSTPPAAAQTADEEVAAWAASWGAPPTQP